MNRDVFEHFNPIDLPCDRCGKVTKQDDIHTCTPRHLTDGNLSLASSLRMEKRDGASPTVVLDLGADLLQIGR